jgi:hypothetical protein
MDKLVEPQPRQWHGRITVRADWLACEPANQLAEELREYWLKRGAGGERLGRENSGGAIR